MGEGSGVVTAVAWVQSLAQKLPQAWPRQKKSTAFGWFQGSGGGRTQTPCWASAQFLLALNAQPFRKVASQARPCPQASVFLRCCARLCLSSPGLQRLCPDGKKSCVNSPSGPERTTWAPTCLLSIRKLILDAEWSTKGTETRALWRPGLLD